MKIVDRYLIMYMAMRALLSRARQASDRMTPFSASTSHLAVPAIDEQRIVYVIITTHLTSKSP